MTVLQTAGELMIGSRLKRLGERLFSEIGRVYKDLNIPFEPAWFPIFFLLDRQKVLPVTALARAIGVSDSAASQFVRKLQELDLVESLSGDKDKRVRLVALSESGRQLLERVRPVWTALGASIAEMESGSRELRQLLALISGLEKGLDQESLVERIRRRVQEPLVCRPLPPERGTAAEKWLKSAGEVLAGGDLASHSWICSQGTLTRGILSVTANGGGDRIAALALDVWELQVSETLMKEWSRHRNRSPWLAVLQEAGEGLWPPRLRTMGFAPERLHPARGQQAVRFLEWRRGRESFLLEKPTRSLNRRKP